MCTHLDVAMCACNVDEDALMHQRITTGPQGRHLKVLDYLVYVLGIEVGSSVKRPSLANDDPCLQTPVQSLKQFM